MPAQTNHHWLIRLGTERVRFKCTLIFVCCIGGFMSQSSSSPIHGFSFRPHQEEGPPVSAPFLSCPLSWRGPSLVNQLKTNLVT